MTGRTLKSNYQYSLLKEAYTVNDAREFLMALLAGITRFHSLNTLRTWERTAAKDKSSEKGIEELSNMRKNILNMLKEMDGEKLSIEIDVEIKVNRKKV